MLRGKKMESRIKFYKSPYDFVKKEPTKIVLKRVLPVPEHMITEFSEKLRETLNVERNEVKYR